MSTVIKYGETGSDNSDTSIFCEDTKIGLTDIMMTYEQSQMGLADTETDKMNLKPQTLNTNKQSIFDGSNAILSIKSDPFEIENRVKQELASNQGTCLTDAALKCEKTEPSSLDTEFFIKKPKIWTVNNTKEQPYFNVSNANTSVKCDPLAIETYVKQENNVNASSSFSTFGGSDGVTVHNSGNDRSASVNENQLQLKCKNKTPFQCDICNKSFSRRDGLKRHMFIHTGEKPHKCDICDKTYSRSNDLNAHKRIHTGEKPHKCDICNKTFCRSQRLSSHKRTHTGERPYVCDVCSKSFTQPHILKIHKRLHSGEKPYQCDICNKTFNQSKQLRSHKRTHICEGPHQCEVCEQTFIYLNNLRRHKLRHN